MTAARSGSPRAAVRKVRPCEPMVAKNCVFSARKLVSATSRSGCSRASRIRAMFADAKSVQETASSRPAFDSKWL